jgi:hypothetical protein
MYDLYGWKGCERCDLADCVRDDILDDPNIQERYEKAKTKREMYPESYARADARWKLKKQGKEVVPIKNRCKGREREYQREYRARMSDEQRERYRKWQREYMRKKRAREREEANV